MSLFGGSLGGDIGKLEGDVAFWRGAATALEMQNTELHAKIAQLEQQLSEFRVEATRLGEQTVAAWKRCDVLEALVKELLETSAVEPMFSHKHLLVRERAVTALRERGVSVNV